MTEDQRERLFDCLHRLKCNPSMDEIPLVMMEVAAIFGGASPNEASISDAQVEAALRHGFGDRIACEVLEDAATLAEPASPPPVGEQGADKPCGTCGGYGLARGRSCWNCSGSGKEPAPPSQDEGLSIEDVHLVALLRREGTYNNVWFADRLLDAANLIERLATPQPQDEGVRDTLAALANRYRDTMGLTREGAIRRIGVLVDAILGSTPATTTTERGRG